MASRKDGKGGPLERLQRLQTEARPASEKQSDTSQPVIYGPLVGGEEPAPLLFVPSHTPDDVTGVVTSDDTGDVATDDTEHMTQHVTRYVTPNGPSDTAHHVAGDVTGDATEQAAAHVAGDDLVAKLNVRVRGRWTAQQKAFIEQLAAEQGATAGEVIRFIIAWYLAQEDRPHQPANRQSLVPSADMLVKRETGMKIFDFLTTSDQAAAIKRAAGATGEAAFMRRALEEFKVSGPLNTKD